MLRKILSAVLIFMLVLSSSIFIFADNEGSQQRNKIKSIVKEEKKSSVQEDVDKDDEDQEDVDKEDVDKDKQNKHKEWKTTLEQMKDAFEAEKDKVEDQKDALEKQYEETKLNGDLELAEELKIKVQQLKEDMKSIKKDMKDVLKQRKEMIKNKYTKEELEKVEKAKKEIFNKNKNVKVLDVDAILSNKGNMKFDTPPVIKGERTLVPIRAIVEGFGAEVKWNSEKREVTIIKGDINILLPIDRLQVYVNGKEVQLDAKAEIMNARTYVPLRFIAETFQFAVNWDAETETIEINE